MVSNLPHTRIWKLDEAEEGKTMEFRLIYKGRLPSKRRSRG